MSHDHTQGRLTVTDHPDYDRAINREEGGVLAHVFDSPCGPGDARRLVACWNACFGIPTEYLDVIAGDEGANVAAKNLAAYHWNAIRLREQRAALRTQTDRLLAALTDIATNGDPHGLRARKALMEHGTSTNQHPTRTDA